MYNRNHLLYLNGLSVLIEYSLALFEGEGGGGGKGHALSTCLKLTDTLTRYNFLKNP